MDDVLNFAHIKWKEFLAGLKLANLKILRRFQSFSMIITLHTPPRTPRISGLKSQVFKPTFLSLSNLA